jgi:hypothetical protein
MDCLFATTRAVEQPEPEMKKRYLLCPQCGTHRFFVITKHGEHLYFHVGWDQIPFPTEISSADLSGVDFSVVHSTGCAWKGGISGLVKYLR